jgi:DNA-binding CsgD family transcriptional regulator
MPEETIRLSALAGFAEAVSAAGSARFAEALRAALSAIAPVDHMTALLLDEGEAPRAIAVASALDRSAARSLTRDYVARHHLQDPILRDFLRLRRRRPVLRRHDPAQLPSRAYAERFFGQSGIVDKVAMLWREATGCFYVNLYRTRRGGAFAPAEVRRLELAMPMVQGLVRLHAARLRLSHGGALPIAATLHERLTPRELAVVAGILRGQAAEGIALELGVALSSVVTFRKRAYAKLGIAGRAELFGLALGALASRPGQ